MTPNNPKEEGRGKRFRAFLWFVGWEHIALGISINYLLPDIELHLPFCFIKIGWEKISPVDPLNATLLSWREKSLI